MELHENKDSRPVEEPKKLKEFHCNICKYTSARKDNLKRHHITVHGKPMVDDDDTMSKTECIFPTCNEMFYHKTKMVQHLQEVHGVDLEKSENNFKTFVEFLDWKEKEEITNFVYFSKQKGVVVGKNTEYSYYICQMDGSEKPHRAKDEPGRKTDKRNKKGQVKESTTCPARMLVHKSLGTGEVNVNYIRTHSHSPSFQDTQHHPIPKSVKEQITGKLALNIPVTQIIQDLREGIGERENRDDIVIGQLRAYQFISKRVMREMHRKMNVKARLHPHDNMSVYLLVSKLEEENFNPIVMYKPLGSDAVVGDAAINQLPHAEDLFAVGIQTREQLKMMNNREILCVDATHGTNQYKYGLLNLIVPDEFGVGYPVAHLITSHQDEKTLYYFFHEIKKRCPDMKIAVIMSDDDYSAPNAIKAVFGEDIRHILCKWHLHRAWQRRLRQDIKDETIINEIYGCLVVILEEKNTEKFHELVESFKEKYNPICESFINYFTSRYMNRTEAWAMCHRNFPHASTDTNMFVEAFHNRLKTFFMDRKPNKRVDDLMNLLLRIEEEDFVRRLKATQYMPTLQDKPKIDTRESRHKRGLQINDKHLDTVDPYQWHVRSQTEESVWHTVTAIQDACSKDHCFEKCPEVACVGLCGHMYHCNCDDFSLLCKHIHKVHAFHIRIQQKASKERPLPDVDDDINADINLYATVELSTPAEKEIIPSPTEKLLETTKGEIAKLGELIGHDAVNQILPHIRGTINNLIAQCKAVINTIHDAPTQPMPQSKIAPNQKLELQPMKRPPKRKLPPSVFTLPSHEQKRDISSSLINHQVDDSATEKPTSIKTSKLSLSLNKKLSSKVKPSVSVPINAKPISSSSNTQPNVRISFTPCWSSVPDPAEIILRNGPHGLTMMNIKSLEPAISRGELLSAKTIDKQFQTGWLYDSVVDSFFWRLQEENARILFACSTTMTAIVHGSSCRLLWANTRLQDKELIFIPYNPQNHWVLFAVDLTKKSILVLDPMTSSTNTTLPITNAFDKIVDIIKIKFNLKIVTKYFPQKCLQKDGMSCGVFVCFYGQQLSNGHSLTTPCETTAFRKDIYKFILKNCQIQEKKLRDICGVCRSSDGASWVECTRCQQWHHCGCVNITRKQAEAMPTFSCPPQ